jgi:hypothetical protein
MSVEIGIMAVITMTMMMLGMTMFLESRLLLHQKLLARTDSGLLSGLFFLGLGLVGLTIPVPSRCISLGDGGLEISIS